MSFLHLYFKNPGCPSENCLKIYGCPVQILVVPDNRTPIKSSPGREDHSSVPRGNYGRQVPCTQGWSNQVLQGPPNGAAGRTTPLYPEVTMTSRSLYPGLILWQAGPLYPGVIIIIIIYYYYLLTFTAIRLPLQMCSSTINYSTQFNFSWFNSLIIQLFSSAASDRENQNI